MEYLITTCSVTRHRGACTRAHTKNTFFLYMVMKDIAFTCPQTQECASQQLLQCMHLRRFSQIIYQRANSSFITHTTHPNPCVRQWLCACHQDGSAGQEQKVVVSTEFCFLRISAFLINYCKMCFCFYILIAMKMLSKTCRQCLVKSSKPEALLSKISQGRGMLEGPTAQKQNSCCT